MRSNHGVARVVVLLSTLLASMWPTTLKAHEIGTTKVSIVMLDRSRFDIEVVTDATALLEKLEVIAGEQPSQTTDPVVLLRRLQ